MLFLKKFNIYRNSYQTVVIDISGEINIDYFFILHFIIERAQGPEGPWQVIAWKPLYASGNFEFSYVDYDAIRYGFGVDYYYRIHCKLERLNEPLTDAQLISYPGDKDFEDVLIRVPSNDYDWVLDKNELLDVEKWHQRTFTNISPIKRLEPYKWDESGIKLKLVFRLRQKYERYLHKFGTTCWIFKEVVQEPCPNCFDEIKGLQKFSNCRLCFGTGYRYPYATPIKTRCAIWHPSETEQLTPLGKMIIRDYRILLPSYPEIFIGDAIILVPMDMVFIVTAVEKNLLYGRSTYQFVQVRREEKNSIKYNLIYVAQKLESAHG
ncbi:MAG: hypothetical protein QXQ43_03690 [Nitrososphaerota archaeon]